MLAILTGPLFGLALLVFVLGMTARIVLYVRGLNWRLERVAYSAQFSRGFMGALASIGKWLVPGATAGWRTQPFMAAAFFLFHIGAILVPFFLVGHTIILNNLTGISLPSLSMNVADTLTILSLVGIALLVLRRLIVPEARALTTKEDWIILFISAMPFVTGFMARMVSSELWTAVHLMSGVLFLIVAPFTKLSHVVLFFMSRAQIGMDFAIKRGGANRGPAFPW